MESEPQPEPVPLGVVNKLLEKELSVRENRLRCIECGHFQPVPDAEPEPSRRSRKRVRSRLQWVPLVTVAVPRE